MALKPADYRHYIDSFNAIDQPEDVVNLIPNATAFEWMTRNVPLLDCPDKALEKIYYYRWWTFRKHIKQTPAGMIVTEFITPVSHAGSYNSISCATGLHLAEGRWIRDQQVMDQYTLFWFRGDSGRPEPKFHKYSSWIASAMLDRSHVNGDRAFLLELLPDLVSDYEAWVAEKQLPDGLFWQFDVRDGMEESISGSRKHQNARPTINSYMHANALAIAAIAEMANNVEIADSYRAKAAELKTLVQERLWDENAKFFKAQTDGGPQLSDAREAIGFIPWMFNLPDRGREVAWNELVCPDGFWAPFGITTAERRHPRFRSHGVGKCEWDGAVWPFATSQTLYALANLLRHYDQPYVTKHHYFDAMNVYVKSQHWGDEPYIGEYLDEETGAWLKGDNPRSRFYNHSTFCDLVITGLIGLVPRADDMVELSPLLPAGTWDFFQLENILYHGHELAITWDRTGQRYQQGAGLMVAVDGMEIARSPELRPLTAKMP